MEGRECREAKGNERQNARGVTGRADIGRRGVIEPQSGDDQPASPAYAFEPPEVQLVQGFGTGLHVVLLVYPNVAARDVIEKPDAIIFADDLIHPRSNVASQNQ